MPFVLDNSVTSGWYLEDQATPYSEVVAQHLLDDEAWVPTLWALEMTNVLRTACKRQRLIAADAQKIIGEVMQLPINIDTAVPTPGSLLALCLRHDLTSYDAAYLELALRMQLPIATQDRSLRDAALAAGVGVFAAD